MFFEGAEKKIELVTKSEASDLRLLGRPFWNQIVETARASILSEISNEHCQAFLLSESSLFVFAHKVVMITCGKTCLVPAIEALVARIGREQIAAMFFERKNEMFPRDQLSHFFDDVRYLKKICPGTSYLFGSEDSHHLFLFDMTTQPELVDEGSDQTLEILMYGGLPTFNKMQQLEIPHGKLLADVLGFSQIIPGFKIDEHIFNPAGYSLNAIQGEYYFTIHITPQALGAYTSFETNYPADPQILIKRVVELFQPNTFDTVLFSREGSSTVRIPGYICPLETEEQLSSGYRIQFHQHFNARREQRQPALNISSLI